MKLDDRQIKQVTQETPRKNLLIMQWGYTINGMCFMGAILTTGWFILPMIVGILIAWYGQTHWLADTLETYDDMQIQGTLFPKDKNV